MNTHDEIWGVIVNPYAGTKKLKKDWMEIYRLLKKANIRFKHQLTTHPEHAIELTRKMVETGFRHILVVGGDGTLNEVVNGIYSSNIKDKNSVTIALIPYGTGNDWARYWGLRRHDYRIAKRLSARKTVPIDIGLLNIHSEEGVVHKYFLNGCGLGFDAFVVKMTNFMKQRLGGGAWVYHLSIFLSVFGYGSKKMRITDHEKSIDTNIFTIAIGNGCYSGGGLKQTPKAKPNDGIFHITAIQRPDLWRIIKGLNQLFNDKLDEHPLAYNFITHQFTIESNETFLCETDGVLQPIANKYDVEIIPNALQMLI